MRPQFRYSLLFALFAVPASTAEAQSPRQIRSADIYRLRDVGAARLSPDGA